MPPEIFSISLKYHLMYVSYLIQDRISLSIVELIVFELVSTRTLHNQYKTSDFHSSKKNIIKINMIKLKSSKICTVNGQDGNF